MAYKLYTFDDVGFLHGSFTDEDLLPLRKEVDSIKNNFENSTKNNKHLAGNIKKEFRLDDQKMFDHLENLFFPMIDQYNNFFRYTRTVSVINAEELPLMLSDIWINFQEKYEFNPIHKHTGIMSFVIWLDIPYSIEDERNQFIDSLPETVKAGTFNFYYLNSLGKISEKTIFADRTYRNNFLLFPSEMNHCVYPFYTSDDYRISVSGNFVLNFN